MKSHRHVAPEKLPGDLQFAQRHSDRRPEQERQCRRVGPSTRAHEGPQPLCRRRAKGSTPAGRLTLGRGAGPPAAPHRPDDVRSFSEGPTPTRKQTCTQVVPLTVKRAAGQPVKAGQNRTIQHVLGHDFLSRHNQSGGSKGSQTELRPQARVRGPPYSADGSPRAEAPAEPPPSGITTAALDLPVARHSQRHRAVSPGKGETRRGQSHPAGQAASELSWHP